MVGLLDALDFERKSKRGTKKPKSFDDILLLSVGTGKETVSPYNAKSLLNSGKIGWIKQKESAPIIELLMASQSTLVEYQVKALLNKTKGEYKRLNPPLTTRMQLDDLDFSLLTNLTDLTKPDIDWLNKNFIKVDKA